MQSVNIVKKRDIKEKGRLKRVMRGFVVIIMDIVDLRVIKCDIRI